MEAVAEAGQVEVMPPLVAPVDLEVSPKIQFTDVEEQDPHRACENVITAINQIKLAGMKAFYYRLLLGHQLIAVQANQLWECSELRGDGEPAETWDQWISEVFPGIVHVSRETGYVAMKLARCRALARLSDEELRSWEHLTSAIQVARLEARGEQITPELLEQARTLPAKEFRKITGSSAKRGRVEANVESPEIASDFEKIISRLKDADPDSIAELRELIDGEVAELAGDNPTDIVDFMLGALRHEVASQVQGVQTGDIDAEEIPVEAYPEE